MSIKGFPSSQKLPLGTGITNEFVTVVPSDEYRYSLDFNRPLFRVNSSTVPRTAAANTGNIDGMTWVYDTSTPAKKGDFVRFEDGNAQFIELPIVKVETNRFMVGSYLANPPAAGNTFYILRSVSSLVSSDGSSSSALPTGAATSANQTNGSQKTQIVDGSGNVIASTGNALNVALTAGSVTLVNGLVSTANSSTTPLGISASFTGTSADITNYSAVEVLVATDRSGILNMQFSSDGTNWDHDDAYACTVTTGGVTQSFYFQGAPIAKYFRVKYDNDGTAQGVFRLQTVFKVNAGVGDIQDLSTAPVDASNGMVTKSVIYGLTTGGGGGYRAVKVNPSGALTTDVSGTVAATQSGTWNIGTVSTITNSVAVTGTFWQATQPISAAALPLPSGAATETTLGDVKTSVQLLDNAVGTVAAGTAGTASLLSGAVYNSSAPTLTTGQQVALQVDSSGNLKTTATFTGSIGAVNQGTANTVANAWPILMTDGTNTAAVKAASTAAVASDPSVVVALSPNSATPAAAGRSKVAQLYNDYTSTSVTTSAYVQLTASTVSAVNKIEIFDSSGEALILAVGGAGSEVDQLYIFPGGNGPVDLAIPASSRISVKAKTATASAGFLAINLYS
jgi:hypothetical protein